MSRTLTSKNGSLAAALVRPATMVRKKTGLRPAIGINPCTIVNRRIAIKRNASVKTRIIVSKRADVNTRGHVFPKSTVNLRPRSLGCSKTVAQIRVNSRGLVHRYIAVGHPAATSTMAHLNDRGLLVTCTRITRGYVVRSRIIVTGSITLTNRIRIRS